MPRGRTNPDNNSKASKEKRDRRKERELKKLSDFWSTVTGDIIGPRRRMRTYRTHENPGADSKKHCYPNIPKNTKDEARLPKIRISLRKEATICFADDTGNIDDIRSNLSSVSSVSSDCNNNTDQVRTGNVDNKGIKCQTEVSSNKCEDKRLGSSAKLRETPDKNVKKKTCIANEHAACSSSQATDSMASVTSKKCVSSKSKSDSTEHQATSISSYHSLKTKRKELSDLLKNKNIWDELQRYVRGQELKPSWDTQLLCHDKTDDQGQASPPNGSRDLDNYMFQKEKSANSTSVHEIIAKGSVESMATLDDTLAGNQNAEKNPTRPCVSDGGTVNNVDDLSHKSINVRKATDSSAVGLEHTITPTSSPSVLQLKHVTRSRTRTPQKFGLKSSRDELFKSLSEPSPRKRKQVDYEILNDIRLAKHACALWFSECRRQFQQRHPKASSQQLDELMREGWDRLTPRHRLPYFVRARSALEDRYQERRSKAQRKQYIDKELIEECTLENFLKLTGSEQDTSLKRGLYKLQKQLSRVHYEAFLETVMMKLIPPNHSENEHLKIGLSFVRQELYQAILALKVDMIVLSKETEHMTNNDLLQDYHRNIGTILGSADGTIGQNGVATINTQIQNWAEINIPCENNKKEQQIEYGKERAFAKNAGGASLYANVPGAKYVKTYADDHAKAERSTSLHSQTLNTKEESLCSEDYVPYYGQVDEEAKVSQSKQPYSRLPDMQNGDIGGCGDFTLNDIRGSPTYKDIFNYLKFGSVTGTLKLKVAGKDWVIPNVVNRHIYKEVLLNAITDDLPVLGYDDVHDHLNDEF